jgi:PKD repeat protein
MSSIFNNDYTMAVVAGFPESAAEYSFSTNVLSEFKSHPGATLGELMQNKTRRCGDWVLFGDPAMRIASSSDKNVKPVASIDYVSPNMIERGSTIYFKGSGFDSDGKITAYSWRSSLDGELSTSSNFSTATLSVGIHTVYFKVKDNEGEWSEEVEREITVLSAPMVYISSPVNQQAIQGATAIRANAAFASGTLRAMAFYVDNRYIGYDPTSPYEYPWDTRTYKNGAHRLRIEASFDNPVRTIASTEITVSVENPLPTVVVANPMNNSIVNGSCRITVSASDMDKTVRANFYVDSVLVGSDYSYPFEWIWDTTTKSNGQHEVFVEVYYSHIGQYVRSPRIVLDVENPKATTGVTILSPANGSEISGVVIISVQATGQDLLRVYFYIDGQWKGYASTGPYTLEWNTKYASNGPHEIRATALYGKNPPYQEVKSDIARVRVNNG